MRFKLLQTVIKPSLYIIVCSSIFFHSVIMAQPLRVAVASNFLLPLKYIVQSYNTDTGEVVKISAGSTGKLYAQIINGAPYDIFMAANTREPERLEQQGFLFDNSRFTYARGKLALWSANKISEEQTFEQVLKDSKYNRLAIANPKTAPYGAAAESVINRLKLDSAIKPKLIRGENISQAYQFVVSHAADLGFVAMSQLKVSGENTTGQYWAVDESLYPPIRQQAGLLISSRQPKRAERFLNYLKSDKVRKMIEYFGYGLN